MANSAPLSDVIKDKDHYLKNEILIDDFDTEKGVHSDRIYTGNDRHHFTVSYQFSPDYSDLVKIQAFEAQYHYRFNNMHDTWVGFMVKKDQNKFSAISSNSSTATRTTTSTDDYELLRADETEMSILSAGLGVGYRFKLLLEFFKTEQTFEKVMVFFNYLSMTDGEYNFDYSGYGLTADYSLLVRSGKNFIYGIKLTYNMGIVKKKALIEEESSVDRTRSIGWLSSGFVLGYNF